MSDEPHRLIAGALALGVPLDPSTADQLLQLLDELLHWPFANLTAIRKREAAIELHLIDSLSVLPTFDPKRSILDVGSGGGIPGLVLAIAWPDTPIVLVDKKDKAIRFLRHVINGLALKNAIAFKERLEPETVPCAFELQPQVVTRAFGDISTCLNTIASAVLQGGRLVLMRGKKGEEEARLFSERGSPGWRLNSVRTFQLPYSGATRTLLTFERASESSVDGYDFPGCR